MTILFHEKYVFETIIGISLLTSTFESSYKIFAGTNYSTISSVTHDVSSATHGVSKATTVDFCVTHADTTHNVSNVSSDVLNNQLYISLLIISIIVGLIIIAYVSVLVVEKYWIQLNQRAEDLDAI